MEQDTPPSIESRMGIQDFAGKRPEFLPEQYLSGDIEGWGLVEGPLGGLQRRYTIKANGTFAAGVLNFSETWTFDNGEQQTLDWMIRKVGPQKYEGNETNLVGKAEGEQAGFAFHWMYTRDTPAGDKKMRLNFDDWFYLIDERVCIVRGSAGRAGIPFAIAHVTYRKI